MLTHPCCPRWLQPFLLLCVAVLAWPNALPARASTNDTTAANAAITLTASADSTIDEGQPTVNFGTDVALRVASPAAAAIEIASLIQFDLTDIPAGAIVTRAELHLFQRSPASTPWQMNIDRNDSGWQELSVTWMTQPSPVPVYAGVPVPAGEEQRVAFDVTTLVQSWLHGPFPVPNFGLRLSPAPGGERVFASSESAQPPQLYVEYTPLPSLVVVPTGTASPTVDGLCDRTEYAAAALYRYGDVDGSLRPIYLLETRDALYVCVEGVSGRNRGRTFGLYLDTDQSTDESGNETPNADDFVLEVNVVLSTTRTLQGTGDSLDPYASDGSDGSEDFGPWEVSTANDGVTDSAEYRIPMQTLRTHTPTCGATIGLGIYHQDVRTDGDDAGWPTLDGPTRPAGWMPTRVNCPIRVCVADAVACDPPGAGAAVFRTGDGRRFPVDAAGYVLDRAAIVDGNQLWAIRPLDETNDRFTVYATNGAPQTVETPAFDGPPSGVMTLVVSEEYPLILHDLTVSTQWTLTPDERTHLEQQIVKASNLLYDFTDGQFALGSVTVHQNYEEWGAADLWTYANNNLRPKATAGGVVEAETADPNPANDLSYFSGYVHMGRYWNRFHAPEGEPIVFEGEPVDPSTLADDWAIALAHEMGHYALFLFDTYFGVGPDDTIVAVDSCTGSAMGWVYENTNWGFVHDPGYWGTNCAATHANQLLGREEWATIVLHYPWLNTPSALVAGPEQPPAPVTQVTFVAPAEPGAAFANQVYDLLYQNGENASRKALAFIFRDDRVIGQGNVVKGTTQIELVGAQANDRFCVYDIDAAPPAPDTPRHQYGCETLAAGDNQLALERDPSWRPIVLVDPVGPTSIAISVTQPTAGSNPMVAVVYPEHISGSSVVPLTKNGQQHTGTADLGASTPSAYIQIYVAEAASELNPRREAMAMYGVDGGTVPGPSSWNQKAPVYSPDGSAIAWPIEAIRVEAGQWVSMQYMVETFDSPSGSTRLSDAYRVISWPPELAQQIIVSVMVDPLPGLLTAADETPASAHQTEPVLLRYWTGERWQVVATHVTPGQDGHWIASGILPANAVFAVFSGPVRQYLPAAIKP